MTCRYASIKAEQTFVVPAGVTSVQVTAIGGAGGEGAGTLTRGPAGGRGGIASGVLTGLAGGSTLYVEVGGNGSDQDRTRNGGFNGGGESSRSRGAGTTFGAGGGGGASDVRTVSAGSAGTLDTRLIVAGGGGGAANDISYNPTPTVGAGGDAGSPGEQASNNPSEVAGGGGAGTAESPGDGGRPFGYSGSRGVPGSLNQGGAGADLGGTTGAGGGGSGLYGGGGGATTPRHGGGGGGGSSLVPAGGTIGVTEAEPSVTITYTTTTGTTTGTATSARGSATLYTGGRTYVIAVDAEATVAGQASGRFALAGGGVDTTAGSRSITTLRRTTTGRTVTGTAVTAAGKQVDFILTVVDRPHGRDQVTVQIGPKTVTGTLTNGDITN